MTATDPRPAAWLAAYDLLAQAQRIRVDRDRHTLPRSQPEPMPEAYWLCLVEAQAWTGLASVPGCAAREVGELLAERATERDRLDTAINESQQ